MRLTLLLSWALALSAPSALAGGAPDRQPYTPADDSEILEQLPPRGGPSGQLRPLQAALLQHPDDLDRALLFARAAIDAGRAEQDPRDFGYAESALAPWWHRADAPDRVVLLRAVIEQWRHDFNGAARDLDLLIGRDSDESVQAHLQRAALHLVAGEPLPALRDCVALIGHTDLLGASTCIANANGLRGRAQPSLDSLVAVLPQSADAAPAVRLWALTSCAEMAERLGRDAQAAALYEQALAMMDAAATPDPYLLASAADFMLRHDDAQQVAARLAPLERIDNLLLRLALAESALAQRGDSAMARRLSLHLRMLGERFAEARQRQDASVHLREEAWYELELLHHPDLALALARRNWQAQREPLDARILLQAALAARQADAAEPVRQWMRDTGIEDVQLQALARRLDGTAAP